MEEDCPDRLDKYRDGKVADHRIGRPAPAQERPDAGNSDTSETLSGCNLHRLEERANPDIPIAID
jgi:hypothetical protein